MQLPFPCPNCKHQNIITIAQAKQEVTVQCQNCGVMISLNDKEGKIKRAIEALQKTMDDMDQKLK
jgi:transcription elongation factor Elf1